MARGLGSRTGNTGAASSSRSAMPAISPRSTPSKARAGDGDAIAAVARRNGGEEALVALAVLQGSSDHPTGLDVAVAPLSRRSPRRHAQQRVHRQPRRKHGRTAAPGRRRSRARYWRRPRAGAAAGGYSGAGASASAHGGAADRRSRRLAARARASAGRAGDPLAYADGLVAAGGDDRHRLHRDDRTTEIGACQNQPRTSCSANRAGGSPAAAPAAHLSPVRAACSRAMVPEPTARPKLPPRTLHPGPALRLLELNLNLPNAITLARLAFGAAGDLARARRALRGRVLGVYRRRAVRRDGRVHCKALRSPHPARGRARSGRRQGAADRPVRHAVRDRASAGLAGLAGGSARRV